MTKEEIQKNSEHWYEKYKEVKHELEQERKLNAEIKARFVKCNTCTDEMKSKCLMFSENLCEGERCEELVDLMALVEKNDLQTKYELLGERCNQLLKDKGELADRYEELQEQNSHMFNTIALQEQQIEKMKRHCNCKHRDSEGYCEVKRTYLMDLSYEGCDKWELED